MVASKAASQSSKRKKTEDMPDSPPKRVTRARAKASSSEMESHKAKVTKIVTASAKVGVETKRLAKPVTSAKTGKRGAKAADDDDVVPAAQIDSEEPSVKHSANSRTRPKKSEEEVMEKPLGVKGSAPPQRRNAKPPVQKELHAEAPKPRGRPKKSVITAISTSSDVPQVAKPEPTTKTIRGRAAAIAAKSNPPPSIATAPTRKRVKFQDESEKEKENIQQPCTVKEPASAKTGLKAKPVRKPAASRTITRSKKAQDEKKQLEHAEEFEAARPLSPKKVKQIAKSYSVGSEDELCHERTPVKALSKSPLKPPMSTIREMSKSASKPKFDDSEMPSSPTRSVAFTILTSPARRPPPSPFKDSLKDSPKRVNLGDSMAPVSKTLLSPTKATLLQSPAKRPVSPLKVIGTGSPQKPNAEIPSNHSVVASTESKKLKPPLFSPSKVIGSPLRAVRSPENPFKVLQFKASEQEVEPVAKVQVSPKAINSPELNMPDNFLSSAAPQEEPSTETEIAQTGSPPPQSSENVDVDATHSTTTSSKIECEDPLMAKNDALSTIPPEPAFVAPSFSFASRRRFAAEESESEDELVSSSRGSKTSDIVPQTLPATLQSKMTQGGFEWSPIPNGIAQPFSMTPLATQLDGWVASSPQKTVPTAPHEQKRGLFSPFAPTFFGQSAQVSGKDSSQCIVNGDPGAPYKSSFFEDCFYPEITADQEQDPIAQSATCEVMNEEADSNQHSQASQEYGDENALPMDLTGLEPGPAEIDPRLTCTPATVFAPFPREIHTVSKVPLRPAGDDSPTKMPRKRSRSLAGSTQTISGAETASTHGSIHISSHLKASYLPDVPESTASSVNENETPAKPVIDLPRTPGSAILSSYGTPGRTVRKGLVPNVLKGAVVYVDVHTSEGADASGIFLDLLTQMGARCVKQWLWNPRAGAVRTNDDAASASDSDGPGNKIGITHVVYKDGGKRTLEKVREAKGVVLCVGVGWVLEYVLVIVHCGMIC